MAFVSERLRRQLEAHRHQQHRAWAAVTPEQRLRGLLELQALVLATRGSFDGVDTDESPTLWRQVLARRRALSLRGGVR